MATRSASGGTDLLGSPRRPYNLHPLVLTPGTRLGVSEIIARIGVDGTQSALLTRNSEAIA